MVKLYSERLNPSALWFWGAQVLFPRCLNFSDRTWPSAILARLITRLGGHPPQQLAAAGAC